MGSQLETERQASMKEYTDYASKVKSNPDLLPPLQPDSFSAVMTENLKSLMSPKQYQEQIYKVRLDQGLRNIANGYRNSIQAELKKLALMDWSSVKQE